MHRRESDGNRGICCRLIRFVLVKLTAGQKEEDKFARKKLIKKESKSDITIYFKAEDSDHDNTSRPERERVIMLVNGSNGSKKMIHEKEKSMVNETSFIRPVVAKLDEGESYPKPLLNDINKKSDVFIKSRLEKMRKSL